MVMFMSDYQKQLVRRGEFLLDFKWVSSWDSELEQMNKKKRGRPYVFPNSMLTLQSVWHQFLNSRGVEGVTRKLSEYNLINESNDHSTICRREVELDLKIEVPKNGNFSCSADGTGMKIGTSGYYKEEKHGNRKRKKFIKVVITTDPVTKDLLGITVGIEGEISSEPDCSKEHMKELIENENNIDMFYGDGAFDKFDMFLFCEENDIEPGIKIRKNAVLWGDSPPLRIEELMMLQLIGYNDWSFVKDYGKRWVETEGYFSSVKRIFGENLKSKTKKGLVHEAMIRFWAYQKMKKYGECG